MLPSISNNPSIIHTRDIAQICAPLFRNTDIYYFGYFKVFKDQSYCALSSDSSWAEHFYYTQYTGPGYNGKPYQEGFHFGEGLKNIGMTDAALRNMTEGFNLHNVIAFVDKNIDHYNMFMLGTPKLEHSYIDFYLNNIEILKKFFSYFTDKSADIILKASSSRIMIQKKFQESFKITTLENNSPYHFKKRRNLLNQFALKNDNLVINNIHATRVTPQELKCLNFSIRGMPAKTVAAEMGISPRTVETHLENLKIKFNVFSKAELIDKTMSHIFMGWQNP